MTLPPIDIEGLVHFLADLCNTPSPTGFCDEAINFVEKAFAGDENLTQTRTRKGGLVITLAGESHDSPRALTAHVDALGAVVKEIKGNGRLKMSQVGGYAWNAVEGEGVTVFTRSGAKIRGSILISLASSHVHGGKTNDTQRSGDNMEVRLDEKVFNADDVRKLGIEVGDFIAFDPRVELTNGFVRSRHLDDKAGVACIFGAVKAMQKAGLKPRQTTTLLITNYEEVGHGAACGFPQDLAELVCVDMAAIGDGQNSDEFHSTLCLKDSGGPYHHGLSNRLRDLADSHEIDYKVDVYPYYGSDGEAFWRAGGDVAVALIGPGVDASHNYERTHTDSLLATTRWILAYLLN